MRTNGPLKPVLAIGGPFSGSYIMPPQSSKDDDFVTVARSGVKRPMFEHLVGSLRSRVPCFASNEGSGFYDFAVTRALVPWGAALTYCTGQGTGYPNSRAARNGQ